MGPHLWLSSEAGVAPIIEHLNMVLSECNNIRERPPYNHVNTLKFLAHRALEVIDLSPIFLSSMLTSTELLALR